MSDKFDSAKVKLPDGRVAYDAVALAKIETEGAWLSGDKRNIPQNCDITVRTENTDYHLQIRGANIMVRDERHERHDGRPNRFASFTPCNIHGSTWGGSMLKMNYIGVDMCLEFSYKPGPPLTTTFIESLSIKEIK